MDKYRFLRRSDRGLMGSEPQQEALHPTMARLQESSKAAPLSLAEARDKLENACVSFRSINTSLAARVAWLEGTLRGRDGEAPDDYDKEMSGLPLDSLLHSLEGHLLRYIRLVDALSAQLQPEDGPPGGPGVIDRYPG